MAIGPGKYDAELSEALTKAKGHQGILLILDGNKGPGFSAQLSLENTKKIPSMLRFLADQIERDVKKI